jgi:hypothetical protein
MDASINEPNTSHTPNLSHANRSNTPKTLESELESELENELLEWAFAQLEGWGRKPCWQKGTLAWDFRRLGQSILQTRVQGDLHLIWVQTRLHQTLEEDQVAEAMMQLNLLNSHMHHTCFYVQPVPSRAGAWTFALCARSSAVITESWKEHSGDFHKLLERFDLEVSEHLLEGFGLDIRG